jgi:predicted DNA-binding transcriptional regulator YafY
VLMCWCELRGDFRNFRTDRIDTAELLESRYPKRRQALLKAWRNSERAARGAILPETDRVGS